MRRGGARRRCTCASFKIPAYPETSRCLKALNIRAIPPTNVVAVGVILGAMARERNSLDAPSQYFALVEQVKDSLMISCSSALGLMKITRAPG